MLRARRALQNISGRFYCLQTVRQQEGGNDLLRAGFGKKNRWGAVGSSTVSPLLRGCGWTLSIQDTFTLANLCCQQKSAIFHKWLENQ